MANGTGLVESGKSEMKFLWCCSIVIAKNLNFAIQNQTGNPRRSIAVLLAVSGYIRGLLAMSSTTKSNKNFFKNFTPLVARDKPIGGNSSSSTEIIVISINATGTRLVTSRTDKSIRIWKSTPERLVDPIIVEDAHSRAVECVSWNPKTEHSFATVGRDEYIKLWKGHTRALERSVKVEKLLGQPEPVALKIVHYSPDGELMVAVDRDSTVILFAPQNNYKKVAEIKLHEHVYDLVWFNFNHGYFACGLHDGTIPIYKIVPNEDNSYDVVLKETLTGHRSSVTSLAVDPRGTFLAAGSNEGVLSFWNTASMINNRVVTDVDESIACIDASRDGTYVAVTYDGGSNIRIFDHDSGEQVYEVPDSVSGELTFANIAWFPNKTSFAYSSNYGTTLTLMKKPERG